MSKPSYEEREQIIKDNFGEFPMRIVFYVYRSESGRYGIQFYKTKANKKIENYKLSSLQKFSFDGSVSTPLEVVDVDSFEELEKRLEELSKMWASEAESDEL